MTLKSIFHKAIHVFSSIVKSQWNAFLEPTRTKQQGNSVLLMETTGFFDWTRTHDLHITSQTCNPHVNVQMARLYAWRPYTLST